MKTICSLSEGCNYSYYSLICSCITECNVINLFVYLDLFRCDPSSLYYGERWLISAENDDYMERSSSMETVWLVVSLG